MIFKNFRYNKTKYIFVINPKIKFFNVVFVYIIDKENKLFC